MNLFARASCEAKTGRYLRAKRPGWEALHFFSNVRKWLRAALNRRWAVGVVQQYDSFCLTPNYAVDGIQQYGEAQHPDVPRAVSGSIINLLSCSSLSKCSNR